MKIIVIRDDGTEHDITEGVQVLYDTVHSSMDFGSGFLSIETMTDVRKVGYACGFEPLIYKEDPCTCGHSRATHRRTTDGGVKACVQGWVYVRTGESSWAYLHAKPPICECAEFVLAESG